MNKIIMASLLCLAFSVCHADTDSKDELAMIKHEAENGDSGAEMLYGLAYYEGRYGLKMDYSAAVKWLKLSAADDNYYAQLILGNCYAEGKGVTQNMEQAVSWWQRSAEGGNAKAQYYLGKAYLDGSGVKHDAQKAIDWLTQSAESGNQDAQFLIGKMYHEGYVVAQDQELTRDWLTRAADNGHTDAINLLGIINTIYKESTMVRQDSIEALTEKAKQGDPGAEYELGVDYESGAYSEDAGPNPKQALYWLNMAANNGNLHAMKTLAEIYSGGLLGVKKDQKKADEWLIKSRGRD
jgi:TPR repeat protein